MPDVCLQSRTGTPHGTLPRGDVGRGYRLTAPATPEYVKVLCMIALTCYVGNHYTLLLFFTQQVEHIQHVDTIDDEIPKCT